jgi:hypothetical protein
LLQSGRKKLFSLTFLFRYVALSQAKFNEKIQFFNFILLHSSSSVSFGLSSEKLQIDRLKLRKKPLRINDHTERYFYTKKVRAAFNIMLDSICITAEQILWSYCESICNLHNTTIWPIFSDTLCELIQFFTQYFHPYPHITTISTTLLMCYF